MSQWGAILDDLLAKAEAAMPTMTVDKRRAYVTPEEVPPDVLQAENDRAMACAYVAGEENTRGEFGRQVGYEVTAQLQLWATYGPDNEGAQEKAYLVRDAFKTTLAADPKLGGLVRDAYISRAVPIEMPPSGRIVLVFDIRVAEEWSE